MFDLSEATARWARVSQMMQSNDLDLVLATDLSRDEILLGHARWLTGYIAIGGPAAALVHRNGHVELISERIGMMVPEYYKAHALPIEPIEGFSPALLAERITRHRPRRLGIAEPQTLSSAIAGSLGGQSAPPYLVDVSAEFERLRLRKSPYEIACIRRSCAIADSVWAQVPDVFRVGRRKYEIMADIEHLVRMQGSEGGFHLILPLPFVGRPMQSLASDDRIDANARYLLEISPRYDGYYSQLTVPVTTHPNDDAAVRAYNDLVAAKQAAQPHMKPGADLSEIAKIVAGFLKERGRAMTSLSLGHFCGMALEEPRHDPNRPFLLEEGMTLIFHPILADPELRSLMRADTYLITQTGAERLNHYGGGMLTGS
ncbi:M24 family metallopeptidase [Lichenicoccus sp.]|uniref:M24 family metallopeptidase n=1 Tax=Lichenicoccus sp. TaxID=2781899 RepID=UPI003D0DE652